MDKNNADEGGNDDDMGGDDANVGGDNVDEGEHDVYMGWDSEDIDTQVNEWIHFAQLNINSLDVEEGYYNAHSSQDGDGIPNEEDIRRCEVFGYFLNGANNIFEEENNVFKSQPQTDYESLHVGMELSTIYEAREYLRKFAILNKFETKQVKNESCRLRCKCAVKNTSGLCFKCSHIKTTGYALAKAFVKADKQVFLDKLKVDNPEAKRRLDKEPAEYWCRSHFDFTAKCKHITNNFSESFNNWILKIIDKPLDKTVNIEVLPPPLVRGAGRPRKVRRKGDDEGESQQKRFHKCGHLGHSKKTCKSPPAELRQRGSQPTTRLRGGGRPRAPTLRGRGRRGTNMRGRGNNQTGRSGSGIIEAVRGNTVVVRGGRGNTQAGRGNTTVIGDERGNTQAGRCGRGNNIVVRGGRDNTEAGRGGRSNTVVVRGGRGTTNLSQELIIPTQGSQISKQPPNNPYKKLFRPPREVWLI
ncbi:hypothetical protein GIB67_031055 [Kingdonia uniflora]|uniref:Transposase n=1 Tax=Kingdonia uniflora TaxID=39325 RepID=A0A7J7NGA3_9MAGN|nr:hypothetical protein GIB67_031055 [Kingdonia uniflora]